MQMIRRAIEGDVARIVAIARAAYIKYVPRIGREPLPMLADFAGEIAAGHVVVLEITGTVEGYLISWPDMEAYFIDNIAVDPAHQGLGLGRQLRICRARSEASQLIRHPTLHQFDNDGESWNLRPYGI